MPVVPLFHANGWSIGFAAPMAGAALVMPGRDLTPPALYEMLETGVTLTAAVPTIWMALLAHLDANNLTLSTLKRVIIGGASCPRAVIERFQNRYGVQVLHAWGMTEMSPDRHDLFLQARGGKPRPGRGAAQRPGNRRPSAVQRGSAASPTTPARASAGGKGQGKLWGAGPAWSSATSRPTTPPPTPDGWFDTGDMAVMDAHGYVRITDRSKDVIKSGGEWISSIELENAADRPPRRRRGRRRRHGASEMGRASRCSSW